MLQNEWTTQTAWAAQKAKNVCTEFFNAAKPRSRQNVGIVNIPASLCHQPSCNKSMPTHDIKISSTAEKFQTPRTLKISNTADIKNFKHRQNVSTSTFQHLYAIKHHATARARSLKFVK